MLSGLFTKRYQGWIHPGLQLPASLLEDPWNGTFSGQSELLLDCDARRIYRCRMQYTDRCRPVFVYVFRNHSWSRALRRPYATRSRRMAGLLAQHGFGTLDIVATLRPAWQCLNWSSVLVALEICNVFELPSFGNHFSKNHASIRLNSELVQRLGREVGRLHQKGFFHGDLKTRHILYDRDRQRFFFIDLEKTAYLPSLPAMVGDLLAGRDLVQLVTSLPASCLKSEELSFWTRFWGAYREARQLSRKRISSIRRVLTAYGPGGNLKQGASVWKALFNRTRARGYRGQRQAPEQPQASPPAGRLSVQPGGNSSAD